MSTRKINLFEIVEWFKANEPWVTDDKRVNSEVGLALREIKSIEGQIDLFKEQGEFIQLFELAAYLRFDLFLTMFADLGIKQEGFGGEAFMFCYDTIENTADETKAHQQQIIAEANVILQRIALMIRAELTHDLFGDENRARVLKAIEKVRKQTENN